MLLNNVIEGESGEIGISQLQELWAEVEIFSIEADVANFDESEEKSTSSSARQVGENSNFAERHAGFTAIEGSENV